MKKSLDRWDASTYTASWYDAVALLNDKYFILKVLEIINIPSDASILEIGAGSGKWSAAFSILGFHVTAIDSNPEILNQIKRNFPNIEIELVKDELPKLRSKASKRKYEIVFNEGVIEHFMDKNERIAAIRSMGNCCISGGYVYFIVPFLSDKEDEYRYTNIKEMNNEVVAAGLELQMTNIMKMQVIDKEASKERWHNHLQVIAKKR